MAFARAVRCEPVPTRFAPIRIKSDARGDDDVLNRVASTGVVRRWTAFNTVGAAGLVVQVAIVALLVHGCGWHYLVATAIAVEVAVVHNFAWHHRWTWKDRPAGSRRSVTYRFIRFQMLNGAISLAGNLLVMTVMTGLLGADPVRANVVAVGACALLNFAAGETIVFRRRPAVLVIVLAIGSCTSLSAQEAVTIAGWDRYRASLDAQFYDSGAPHTAFFALDRAGGQPAWRDAVGAGQISVRRLEAAPIPGSSVHHWAGAVFIPAITVDDLVSRLKRAAGHEAGIYDDVVASKLLAQDGDRFRIFMKLRRTTLITVTYNTEHAVEYRRLGAARYAARSVATRIAEVSDAGTARERERAPGDDSGFLWRLAAYWRYETWSGGVLVECESASLSRPVPVLLRPVANPIVDRIARESLESTLRHLRTMAAAR
jgi:putative flippase GtrA